MSKYGETLRALVDMSGVKLSVIAREVGYDLSYVSKWCNKDKLPAVKVAPEIHLTMGRLFATELIALDARDEFYDLYETYLKEFGFKKSTLHKDVTRLLNITFEESRKEADKRHSSNFAVGETLIRTSEISDFFGRRLPEMILDVDATLKENETIEVLCTLDICRFLNTASFDSSISRLPLHDIHVRMGLNMGRFSENPSVNLKQLYYFINSKEYISFDFYDDTLMTNLNTIVIKDQMAILCALDHHGHIITVSVITNPDDVNQIYDRILPSFRTTDLIMHHAEPENMNQYGYRTGFYALSGYQIFQPYGFEFLLPEECWPNIAKAAKKMDPSGNLAKDAERLHITWQETFEKGIIDFFVTKSSIMRYMEDGEILFSDVPYHMTAEERKYHIQNTLALAKKNPNIKFYVINDDDLPSVQHLLKTAVYSNGKQMFLKCPNRYKRETGPWMYSVVSETIIQETTKLLKEISSSSYCYEYNGKNLSQFMDKYGSMVYRIIDLG